MKHIEYLSEQPLSEKFELDFGAGPEFITLRGNSLDFGEHKPAVLLTDVEGELVRWLASPLNEPRLAKTVKSQSNILDKRVKINEVFESIREKFKVTPLAEHLITVGHGSGQWYGLLYKDSDDERAIFAHNGIDEVDSSRKKLNKEKRKEPFEDLLFLIENGIENERHTTNRKKILAGSAVVSITIGTAATVYVLRHVKLKEK
jgi:hypothetical protein